MAGPRPGEATASCPMGRGSSGAVLPPAPSQDFQSPEPGENTAAQKVPHPKHWSQCPSVCGSIASGLRSGPGISFWKLRFIKWG